MILHNPNPLQVVTHSDRLAREQGSNKLGLAFSAITAINLGVMTTKMLVDMFRDMRGADRGRDQKRSHGR